MYLAITTDICSSIVRIVLNECMLLSTLGQRLRKQRQHKNYTQHDLAQQAGVSNAFSLSLKMELETFLCSVSPMFALCLSFLCLSCFRDRPEWGLDHHIGWHAGAEKALLVELYPPEWVCVLLSLMSL